MKFENLINRENLDSVFEITMDMMIKIQGDRDSFTQNFDKWEEQQAARIKHVWATDWKITDGPFFTVSVGEALSGDYYGESRDSYVIFESPYGEKCLVDRHGQLAWLDGGVKESKRVKVYVDWPSEKAKERMDQLLDRKNSEICNDGRFRNWVILDPPHMRIPAWANGQWEQFIEEGRAQIAVDICCLGIKRTYYWQMQGNNYSCWRMIDHSGRPLNSNDMKVIEERGVELKKITRKILPEEAKKSMWNIVNLIRKGYISEEEDYGETPQQLQDVTIEERDFKVWKYKKHIMYTHEKSIELDLPDDHECDYVRNGMKCRGYHDFSESCTILHMYAGTPDEYKIVRVSRRSSGFDEMRYEKTRIYKKGEPIFKYPKKRAKKS